MSKLKQQVAGFLHGELGTDVIAWLGEDIIQGRHYLQVRFRVTDTMRDIVDKYERDNIHWTESLGADESDGNK